jgi:polyisoprenoid-binding protein YceI
MVNISKTARQPDIPAAGRYRIDPGLSSVVIRSAHIFGLGPVSGTMQVISGEVALDPAVPAASITAAVSARSFSTGTKGRDDYIRKAKLLNVAVYPEITYRAGQLTCADGCWTVTGELTIRGTTRPASLVIESVEASDAGFSVSATTRVDRYAFGVSGLRGMIVRYADVTLTVGLARVAEA